MLHWYLTAPEEGDVLVYDDTADKWKNSDILSDMATDSKVLVVSGTKTTSDLTISNSAITNDMICVNAVLGTPSAQTGDYTVTTSNGSVVVSGTTVGETTITLYLAKSR